MNKSKRKVLVLIRSLSLGGAERQALINAKAIRNMGYSVDIVTYRPNKLSYIDEGINLISINPKWGFFGLFVTLYKVMVQNRYELVYSFTGIPNVLAALLKLTLSSRVKVFWGKRATKLKLKDYNFFYRVEVFLEYLLRNIPDLIIANSWSSYNELVDSRWNRNKLRVVHNGIDTELFRILQKREKNIIPFYSQDSIKIASVARLDPMKDHASLISAFAHLLKEDKNYELCILGRDYKNIKKDLISLATDLGIKNKIIFLESFPNMTKFYNNIDILISSSLYGEGFPNVLAESMACGTPCIATDVGDSSIILGELGLITAPGNVKNLSEALVSAKNMNRNKEEIRKSITTNFSIKKLETRMIGLISEVLD